MASAANGLDETGSGEVIDLKKPCSSSPVIFRLESTSPLVNEVQPGSSPGSGNERFFSGKGSSAHS